MNLLYIYADTPQEMNCSNYLCIEPSMAMNKAGHKSNCIHISKFVENSEEVQQMVMESDVCLIERNLFGNALVNFMFYKSIGKNFVVCFDDGYSVMHRKNVSYPFWNNGEMRGRNAEGNEEVKYLNPPPLTQLGWGISMAKGYQVVSQDLVSDWKHCNPNGHIINHHLVIEKYDKNIEPLYSHPNDIWIGWSGSMSHVDSFESSGLLRAFQKITSKHKNVKILITGDKRIFDTLDLPAGRKLFHPFVPAEKYPALLKCLDIFTIPLSGKYDSRRSHIKPTESSILGIPFLASEFPNYQHIKPYGNFTENSWQNWEEKLTEMIEKLPFYKEKAMEKDIEWGLSQNLDLHIEERIKLYEKMIEIPYQFSFPPDPRELRISEIP